MDSMVRVHHVYKLVWSPVQKEQLILEEPTNPHNEFSVAVIKDSQVVDHILKIIHRSASHKVVIYYTKKALLSVILLGQGGKEGLRENIFIIMDPQKTWY